MLSVKYGLALLLGASVYGFHRSLVYPAIEYLSDLRCAKTCRHRVPLISWRSRKHLYARWRRGSDVKSRDAGTIKHTTNWADWAHMQYASMWCIAAGAAGAKKAADADIEMEKCWPLILIAIAFGLAALVSDWRLRSMEDFLRARALIDENERRRRVRVKSSP